MPFSNLYLPLKIQGGTLCLTTQYFFLSQYFECKQADIEWISCSKIIVFKYLTLEGGGWRGVFILDFHAKRSKRYVEFGI